MKFIFKALLYYIYGRRIHRRTNALFLSLSSFSYRGKEMMNHKHLATAALNLFSGENK